MTKKQFKYDMQRGLGSCLVELNRTQDLEFYKDVILWGCSHRLAYDTQCEGTRSYYLYQMIQLYEDWQPFYQVISKEADRSCTRGEWEFSQHGELLVLMAKDGYQPAVEKVEDIYQHLLNLLRKRTKLPKNRRFHELENMEYLCIAILTYQYDDRKLLEGEYIKIANDLGSLFKENPKLYSMEDFQWLEACCEDIFEKRTIENLLKENEFQPGIKSFMKSWQQWDRKEQGRAKKPRNVTAVYSAESIYNKLKEGEEAILKFAPIFLRNIKNQEELIKLYDFYGEEKEVSVRIRLLKFLRKSSQWDSNNMDRQIADSKSENEALSKMAFEALCYIKDEKVYQYALELLEKESAGEYPLRMLLRNYVPEERDRVIRLVKEVPITKDSGWHSIFEAVEEIFQNETVKQPPEELLYYMYRNTFCSFCRRSVVAEMGKRGMFTKELLEECSFDSNEDIREYAYKWDRKREPIL